MERKATDWSAHPSLHLWRIEVSPEDGGNYISNSINVNIYIDGSKPDNK
ncbi:hypothetical protein AVEN_211609-1, partial [Araneus ventricosus]